MVGYLTSLENMMVVKCPNPGISGSKHINSKLTVWKRVWGILLHMVQMSGFGWNDTNNMVTVECNGVWMKYVKAYPEAESMRFKSYPYFPIWCDLFGNDCATGEGVVGYSEAEGHMNEELNVLGGQTGGQTVAQTVSEEDVTLNALESSNHTDVENTTDVVGTSKKRRTKDLIPAPIFQIVKEYIQETKQFFSEFT